MAAGSGPFPIEAEGFLREHGRALRRAVLRHLSDFAWLGDPDTATDDVMQEVQRDVARSWQSFDPSKGSRLQWALGIARHEARDHVRRVRLECTPHELPIHRLIRVLLERVEPEAEDDALRRAIEECLGEQPESARRFAIEYEAQKRQAHSKYSDAERKRMSRFRKRVIDCAEESLPDF